MPEGDTLHATAARLRPALHGATIVDFEARRLRGLRPRSGERVDSVESVGKHLLIACSGGLVVHTHLQMAGSWQLVEQGSNWPRPAHLLRCRFEVAGWQALCFSAPTVQTWPRADLGTARSPLAALGPDLCRADADLGACVDRLGSLIEPVVPVGDALLDQRVFCGVGNVYRNEVCWALGLHPLAPIAGLTADDRTALVGTAARQLRANLNGGPRRTVRGGLAVYDRAGASCRRCATPIRAGRLGGSGRATFWCPRCQPAPTEVA